jgi:hypothetical protein
LLSGEFVLKKERRAATKGELKFEYSVSDEIQLENGMTLVKKDSKSEPPF